MFNVCFLNIHFGCNSIVLGRVGAVLGLSWEEDLGATWGFVGVAPRWAIMGLSRENLGATLVNLRLRNSCEVETVDFTLAVSVFFESAWIKTFDSWIVVF